jgi:hypothetical protein
MTLGDLLGAARRSASGFQDWLSGADPELALAVERAAGREALSAAGFVRVAIADFSRFADEEDWATLTSALRDSADPGAECLRAMVHWRLTVPGCEAHSVAASQGGSH